jgi:penicillin-binding protein 1C
MKQGLIHPMTMLKDAPTPFGTYTPDNFDRVFAGPLSATDALIHSRNIPAINLAQELRDPSLHEFLVSAEVPVNPDPRHYGLSIVLGTAEVTMEEIVELYAALRNEGRFRKIRKTISSTPARQKEIKHKAILEPEAAFLVLDMLSKNPNPTSGSEERWRLRPQSVAWKTGTSVGFRDAWAVGVFDNYVLAVWVGNFSGQGNSAFVGREAAGPLLFQLIESLAKIKDIELNEPAPSFAMNVSKVEVCSVSGQLPHADCPHKKLSYFVPGKSPIKACTVHRRVDVDVATGKQVCPSFKGKTKSQVYEYWPTDLLKLFKQAGIGRKIPPSLHESCQNPAYGDIGPKILSPKAGIVYHLRTAGSDSKKIPLVAVSDGNVQAHKWYVNNNFVGEGRADNPLLWNAKSGNHTVRVVDDQGRASDVQVEVSWID